MPRIADCPACKEKVTIPDGVAAEAVLRCPLCQAEFSPSDVAAEAVDAPPVLLLVEPAAESPVSVPELEVDATEPVDDLALEVESFRSKTEAFRSDADPSAEEPGAVQVQADSLGEEAKSLLAKVGQVTAEAREAEARAMAMVAKSGGYKKSTGSALAALADALESVAQGFDEKCAALMAQIGEEPPAVEQGRMEDAVDGAAIEREEVNPTEAETATETAEEEAVSVEEPAEEEPEADPFAFLKGGEKEEEPEPVEAEEPVEEEASSEEAAEASDESGLTVDEAEQVDEGEPTAEEPEVAAEEPAVDVEAIRARLEVLRAVTAALKSRAAELRAEADALLSEPGATYEVAEASAEEGGWGGLWQPEGSAPAINLGEGTASLGFGEGAAGRTVRPGRKRKEKSLLGEIVGIVLGGAAGLVIAYYGLNYFGGNRYDFAKIYLPGIKHTIKHRPAWWPEWARFEAVDDAEDDGLDGVEQSLEEATFSPPVAPKVVPPQKAPKPAKPKATPPEPAVPAKPWKPVKAVAETPEPPPAPVAVGSVDLKNPPSYRSDDLGQALKAAHRAFGCPKCNSTGKLGGSTCPDCQGHPPDSLTPAAYPRFCRLGEVLAFLDPTDGAQLDERKAAVRDLMEKVGSKPQNVMELGHLALSLLDDQKRAAPGIVFAGTVLEVETKGQFHKATVKLGGVDRKLNLIGKEPLGLAVKDRILVLGCLAKKNSKDGDAAAASLFVWNGLVVKFPK